MKSTLALILTLLFLQVSDSTAQKMEMRSKIRINLYTSLKEAKLTSAHLAKLKKFRLLLVAPSWVPDECSVSKIKAERESYSISYRCGKNDFYVTGIGKDERGDLIGFIKKYRFTNPIFGTQHLGNVSKDSSEDGKFVEGETYHTDYMSSPKIKEDHDYKIYFSGKFPSHTAIKIASSLRYLKK